MFGRMTQQNMVYHTGFMVNPLKITRNTRVCSHVKKKFINGYLSVSTSGKVERGYIPKLGDPRVLKCKMSIYNF